ncbi:hypothetical protein [Paraburkholderia lacunae]|nr:hypothetical protein [Paraburkholderia lacunae]
MTGKLSWRGARARCISDQIRSKRIEMIRGAFRRAFRRFHQSYSPLILCHFAAQWLVLSPEPTVFLLWQFE